MKEAICCIIPCEHTYAAQVLPPIDAGIVAIAKNIVNAFLFYNESRVHVYSFRIRIGFTKMRETQQWRRIVRLANGDDNNDKELAALSLRVWAAFRVRPTLNGLPVRLDPSIVPSLAQRARETLPDLRTLLRGLTPRATRSQRRQILRLLPEHLTHIKSSEIQAPEALLAGRKIRGNWVVQTRENSKRKLRTATIIFQGPDLGPVMRHPTPAYHDLMDPIIHHLVPVPLRLFAPVRICQRRACGKFFVRVGRRRFCDEKCKRESNQMSTTTRRDYQVKYRAEQLLAAHGARAVRAWIAKVARRHMSEPRRRRLIAVLRCVLQGR